MQESFEDLEKEYKLIIFQAIKSLHVYKDKDLFYQMGLIGLWEASTRFDPEKGVEFSTYAFSIIRGKMLDHLRKESRHADRSQLMGNELITSIIDYKSRTPFIDELFDTYCKDLTLNQRKWVQGRIIDDKSYHQIASEQGVTVEAVKSWGKQAIKKLRETVRVDPQ